MVFVSSWLVKIRYYGPLMGLKIWNLVRNGLQLKLEKYPLSLLFRCFIYFDQRFRVLDWVYLLFVVFESQIEIEIMASAIAGFAKRSIEKIGVWNLMMLLSMPVMGYSVILMENENRELREFVKNKYEELKAKGIIREEWFEVNGEALILDFAFFFFF